MIRISATFISAIGYFLILLTTVIPAWAADNSNTSTANGKQFAKPRPDKALFYLLRKHPFRGLIYQRKAPLVFIDQTPIGVLRNKRYTYIHIDPGEHVIWTVRDNSKNVVGSIRIKASAGETYYLYFQDVYGLKPPRIWVGNQAMFKKATEATKYIARSRLMQGDLLSETDDIIRRNYDYATANATHYPFTIYGSASYNTRRYRPNKSKQFKFYKVNSDKTAAVPTANKALIYVATTDKIFFVRKWKHSSHWTYADDKLVAITWHGKYGYALVDPANIFSGRCSCMHYHHLSEM